MARVRLFHVGIRLFTFSVLWWCCSERPHLPSAEVGSDWRAAYAAWSDSDPIPNFHFIDQDGQPFRLFERASGHSLVGFIFTRCAVPTACPLTMEKMRQVQMAWEKHASQTQKSAQALHLISVTLDPGHDTPKLLRAYGTHHEVDFKSWTMATGDSELLSEALPSLFNVIAVPDAGLTFKHNVKVALLGPDRRLLKSWSDNDFSAAQVLEAMAAHELPGTAVP